ncbi:MAG: hypothetical protein H6Q58_2180 [Firmicutes bacterium]|nr:hypothetical protein [Bacillota bacterium]
MKVMNYPIEVISYTDEKGEIRPIRFRLQINDEPMKVIKIDRIILRHVEKLAGNKMLLFRCQSLDGDSERLFEIKYEFSTCKWFLYKM